MAAPALFPHLSPMTGKHVVASRECLRRCTANPYNFIAQEYLSRVRAGDKAHHPDRRRAGGRHQPGARQSMIRAPTCMSAAAAEHFGTGTRARHEICARIGPGAQGRAGLSSWSASTFIGDLMTEINVTSAHRPARESAISGGPDVAALFWDAVERQAGRKRARNARSLGAPHLVPVMPCANRLEGPGFGTYPGRSAMFPPLQPGHNHAPL